MYNFYETESKFLGGFKLPSKEILFSERTSQNLQN